jgi:hypothetical protein
MMNMRAGGTSVQRPCAISAVVPKDSRSIGCGCVVVSMSTASAPISKTGATSPIMLRAWAGPGLSMGAWLFLTLMSWALAWSCVRLNIKNPTLNPPMSLLYWSACSPTSYTPTMYLSSYRTRVTCSSNCGCSWCTPVPPVRRQG